MSDIYFVKNEDWKQFLIRISTNYRLYAPREIKGAVEYLITDPEDVSEIVYPGARLTTPLKYFFYPPREMVTTPEPPPTEKNILLGIKSCDILANQTQDKIYLDPDFVDPFYKARRDGTIIISSDCPEPYDYCFCSLLVGGPYPKDGFDLNLSLLKERVIIEVGSDKGAALIEEHKLVKRPPEEDELQERDKARQGAVEKLEKINAEFKFPRDKEMGAVIEQEHESPVWDEMSDTCVTCGACTNICPSCHCFLLSEVAPQRLEKERFWDSCQYTGFARVAGGANPRNKRYERFRNRFFCKLVMKPKNYGFLACTACGRCIEACQGEIDIRELYTRLAGSKR